MPSVASLLSAACALPLAAASFDSVALVQGGVQVRRDLPIELTGLKTILPNLNKASELSKKEDVKKTIGDLLFSSQTSAVRLPDNWPMSEAWGQDKLKSVGVSGIHRGAFTAAGIVSSGTDAHEEAHILAGGGYAGLNPENKAHVPSSFGAVNVAVATPGQLAFVGAIPVEGSEPQLAYAKSVTKFGNGHISPDDVPASLRAFLPKAKLSAKQANHSEPTELKATHEEAAEKAVPEPAQAAPAKVEEPTKQAVPEPAQAAPAKVEELTKQAVPVPAETPEPAKLAPAVVDKAVSPEQERANRDFAEYQLKLMLNEIPYEDAFWWSAMRGWAIDQKNQLPPEEQKGQLGLLNGRWTIEKDLEFPKSEGSVMTIQDGKLLSPDGKHVMQTTFKAFVEGKFASVTPMHSKLENSTVDLFKLCHINGTELQFERGNVWRRVGAAPKLAPPTAAPQHAMNMAWQLPKGLPVISQQQMQAAGAEFLKKIGAAVEKSVKSATPEQVKKATDAANGFKLAMQSFLKKPGH